MCVEVNGIAHIQLTINQPEKGIPFWESLLHFLGLQTLIRSEELVYCIGARTGVVVRGAPPGKRERKFDQDTIGLHHLCFRARNREDVDGVYEFVRNSLKSKIIHAPEEGPFAPGYYSILFEDPEGIRIEVNYVPGQGHFGPTGRLGQGGEGVAKNYDESGLDAKEPQ